jgi:tetratricopeptide (TPR) repeat protein
VINDAITVTNDDPKSPVWLLLYCLKAEILAGTGEFEQAEVYLGQARRLIEGNFVGLFEQTYLLLSEARIAAAQNRLDEALPSFEKVAGKYDTWGMKWDQAQVLVEWAGVYLKRGNEGDSDTYRQLVQQARQVYTELNLPVYLENMDRLLN